MDESHKHNTEKKECKRVYTCYDFTYIKFKKGQMDLWERKSGK